MDHSHPNHPNEHHAHKAAEKVKTDLAEKAVHAHEDAGGHPDHSEHGHDHHAMMIDDFKKRFWISLALSIPVVVLSPMVQHILGYTLEVPYGDYIAFVLSSIIFFYGG